MRKLWIAVPCYTGQITAETAYSIYVEMACCYAKGWGYYVDFYQGNPMIHYARNIMVKQFLESDYTDLFFIDSDVGFPPDTLTKLASYPVDIVGAIYPHRAEPLTFPVRYLSNVTELRGGTEPGTEQILEVEGLPAGCMRISRKALETIIEKFPGNENYYYDMTGQKTYSFFRFSSERGEFLGEDWHFCRTARDAGIKIWCDPEIDMTHTGTKVFRGNLGRTLRERDIPDIDLAMNNIMKFAGAA